jgi:hypothetical protein
MKNPSKIFRANENISKRLKNNSWKMEKYIKV